MAKNHWKLVACYQSNLTRCSRWLKPDFWKQQPTQRALQLQCQWRKNSQLLHSSHFEAIFLTAATTSCQNVNMFRLLSLLLPSKLLSNNLDSGKSILLSPLDNVAVLKHKLQLHSANHCNQCIMYIHWFMIYFHRISNCSTDTMLRWILTQLQLFWRAKYSNWNPTSKYRVQSLYSTVNSRLSHRVEVICDTFATVLAHRIIQQREQNNVWWLRTSSQPELQWSRSVASIWLVTWNLIVAWQDVWP